MENNSNQLITEEKVLNLGLQCSVSSGSEGSSPCLLQANSWRVGRVPRAAGTLRLRGNSAPTTNGRSPDPQCLHACRNAFCPPLRNTASLSCRSLSASSGPEDEPGTAPPEGPPTTVHPHGHAHRVAALSYPPAATNSREISAVLV